MTASLSAALIMLPYRDGFSTIHHPSYFMGFCSYRALIFLISISFRPRDCGMIQFLPGALLDSVPNVFCALGVYKCACWGPKISSAFSRTSACAHLIHIVSNTSTIAFVPNARTRIT